MSNNANKLTNEQALQILVELSNLDSLKLNIKEHSAVQSALGVFKELVDAAKTQPTPEPEVVSFNQAGGVTAKTVTS